MTAIPKPIQHMENIDRGGRRETRGSKMSLCEEGDERMQRERKQMNGCKERGGRRKDTKRMNVPMFLDFWISSFKSLSLSMLN